jgi:hypothetical protein
MKRFLLAVVATLCAYASFGNNSFEDWDWRNPSPPGNGLSEVAFGGGRFVTVGRLGMILSTFDGANWRQEDSQTTDELKSVAFGKTCVVAVGGYYSGGTLTGTITTSDKHGQWERFDVPGLLGLLGVVHGEGRFVAIGIGGTIVSSSNGRNWTFSNDSGDDSDLLGLAFGGNRFVAVGAGGTLLTSTSGTNWVHAASTTPWTINGVVFGNGLFVATASYGTILTSSDGQMWNNLGSGHPFGRIYFANGMFFAVGVDGLFYASPDAVNWLPSGPSGGSVANVAWGNGIFIAVGSDGFNSLALVSAQGVQWERSSGGRNNSLSGIVFGRNEFVAVGSGTILTSRDGNNWNSQSLPDGVGVSKLAFGNNRYVAVGGSRWVGNGYQATVLISPDGETWRSATHLPVTFPFALGLSGIAFGAGGFVAVGDGGMILTSRDAEQWSQQVSGTGSRFFCIAFGGGTYVAMAESEWDGQTYVTPVVTSTDGTRWNRVNLNSGNWIFDLTWGKDHFVAVGESGIILTSRDGVSWTPRFSGTGSWLFGVTYGMGRYVAVGEAGGPWLAPILSSVDGIRWSPEVSRVAFGLNAVASGRGCFVAVGDNGAILQKTARGDFR